MHCAAVYAVGVPAGRRDELVDANVRGTERVLGAALTAGLSRAVHVTTVAVFGDTGGAVGWSSRPLREGLQQLVDARAMTTA